MGVGNVANHPRTEGFIMKLSKLTMLSAAALLAGGMSIAAAAENNMAPGQSGASAQPQGQCWDAASNMVKDKTGSASGAKTPGAVTTGSSPSGQNNNATGTGNSKTATNTGNLPKC
jgi:hypothetical protein